MSLLSEVRPIALLYIYIPCRLKGWRQCREFLNWINGSIAATGWTWGGTLGGTLGGTRGSICNASIKDSTSNNSSKFGLTTFLHCII